jgi:hypothetical protein
MTSLIFNTFDLHALFESECGEWLTFSQGPKHAISFLEHMILVVYVVFVIPWIDV